MSTLITDTLKVKGDQAMPVAFAKDVHVDYDDTDLETALEPATDSKLGLVKSGNEMDIDSDGILSTTNRVTIDEEVPDDGTYTWVDTTNGDPPNEEGHQIKVSKDAYNTLSIQKDGLYAASFHIVRPEPIWHFYIDGVQYLKGYPMTLTKTISYYIDMTNGDDTYGDGTAAHPRKTLGGLPRNLGGYTLNVYISGSSIPEKRDFNICYFAGGVINVYMVGNPQFYRLQLYGNACRIYIREGFTCDMSSGLNPSLSLSGWTQSFYISGCASVYLTSDVNTADKGTTVTCTALSKSSYVSTVGTTCYYRAAYIESSAVYIHNRINFVCKNGRQGILVGVGNRFYIAFPNMQNNYQGFCCGYGKVGCNAISYSGNSTNLYTYHGGRVFTGGQSSIGNY